MIVSGWAVGTGGKSIAVRVAFCQSADFHKDATTIKSANPQAVSWNLECHALNGCGMSRNSQSQRSKWPIP